MALHVTSREKIYNRWKYLGDHMLFVSSSEIVVAIIYERVSLSATAKPDLTLIQKTRDTLP